MVRYILIFILILFVGAQTFAQVSQGGSPIEFPRLKKLSSKVLVDLPQLNNDKLLLSSLSRYSDKKLKSLRFAESIPVCLNTSNSGEWIEHDDHRIWTLEIRSEGAKSLNLIFDEYDLPDDARLFIYSADKNNIIGAFTSENNKTTGILATEPIYGDHIILQYEEPFDVDYEAKLSVGEVNHDFLGIVSSKVERRPLGLAGECNVNINCDHVEDYKDVANGVVRIVIAGADICSGTLMNNSRNDGTPYIYTAGHCIKEAANAAETVFLFNYESPYCGEIDGDATHSISGSSLKARSDSLDFSLVEMSMDLLPKYRPYFVGWDRSGVLPDSSVCIHHPMGDIKKIAIDDDSPKVKTYSSDYITNAFLYIGDWDEGTTEGGSSGAALINQDGHFVGSLTGGAANCSNPEKDYFSRLNSAWDYYEDPAMNLKDWLDPEGSNPEKIDGIYPYEGVDYCGAFTNFTDEDVHEDIEIVEGEQNKGFWAGVNDYGFDTFAEKFMQDSSCDVIGVSIGIAQAAMHSASSNSKFKLQVYNGTSYPEEKVHEQEYSFVDVDAGVMNYFEFDKKVSVNKNFFIAFSTDQLDSEDTVSVYLAKRDIVPTNTFFIKDGSEWYSFQDKSGEIVGSALLMEAVLCNIDFSANTPTLKSETLPFEAFPNPLNSGNPRMYIHFKENVVPGRVAIFDLAGHIVSDELLQSEATKWISLDFTGYKTGTYIVRVLTNSKSYQSKVLYLAN